MPGPFGQITDVVFGSYLCIVMSAMHDTTGVGVVRQFHVVVIANESTCVPRLPRRYVWSAACSLPATTGATCSGAAVCPLVDVAVSAVATCTCTGWTIKSGCFPEGCAALPSAALTTFNECKLPGALGQQCRGACEGPASGAPVATCTATGWAFSGTQCGEHVCHMHTSTHSLLRVMSCYHFDFDS